jgi:hypothetical protein
LAYAQAFFVLFVFLPTLIILLSNQPVPGGKAWILALGFYVSAMFLIDMLHRAMRPRAED